MCYLPLQAGGQKGGHHRPGARGWGCKVAKTASKNATKKRMVALPRHGNLASALREWSAPSIASLSPATSYPHEYAVLRDTRGHRVCLGYMDETLCEGW